MISPCPNDNCKFYGSKEFVQKDGRFYRRSESRFIQRFRCSSCGKRYSHATNALEFGQKKRRLNSEVKNLFCMGLSQRGIARFLKISRLTVERKMIYLAKKANLSQEKFLKSIRGKVKHMQFDDMISVEHTKMKPLTISLAVDVGTRVILGARVAPIGAFGHLAVPSRKRYGPRPNRHKVALNELFQRIHPTLARFPKIESDEHKFYPEFVRKYAPKSEYIRHKGGRGAIVGQGELKKLVYDPLFILNHTCAMLRANINRLFRKTWCTTKKPERLQMHLDIFIDYYNQVYLKELKK